MSKALDEYLTQALNYFNYFNDLQQCGGLDHILKPYSYNDLEEIEKRIGSLGLDYTQKLLVSGMFILICMQATNSLAEHDTITQCLQK